MNDLFVCQAYVNRKIAIVDEDNDDEFLLIIGNSIDNDFKLDIVCDK